MKVELPLEIIAVILSRLPVDSIIKCKRLCKTWQTLINNSPLFLYIYTKTAHHHHSSTPNSVAELAEPETQQPFGFIIFTVENLLCYSEYYYYTAFDRLKVTKPFKLPPLPYCQNEEHPRSSWAFLGSANGLICLSACSFHCLEQGFYIYDIYVYNPMTSEYVNVGTETHVRAVGGYRASGFGYHPITKEYKVVRINYRSKHSSSGEVTVYTIGTGAKIWKDKGKVQSVITGVKRPGVLVNGALHWLTKKQQIISFDLAKEEFRIVLVPELVALFRPTIGVFKGCLCLGLVDENISEIVWVMNYNKLCSSCSSTSTTNTDNDDKPSWTRLPINGKQTSYWFLNEIYSDSLKYHGYSKFSNGGRCVDSIPYTKSFVSLKALGEENTKKICSSP